MTLRYRTVLPISWARLFGRRLHVVPKGDFQVENGLLITNMQGQYILDLPETALRFGLLDKTELRLSAPDYFDTVSSSGPSLSGFGDIAIGVKHQFGPIGGTFNLSSIK